MAIQVRKIIDCYDGFNMIFIEKAFTDLQIDYIVKIDFEPWNTSWNKDMILKRFDTKEKARRYWGINIEHRKAKGNKLIKRLIYREGHKTPEIVNF